MNHGVWVSETLADPYVSFGINIEDRTHNLDSTWGMTSSSGLSDAHAARATGESFIGYGAVTVRPDPSANTNVPNCGLVEQFHDSHSLDAHTHPDLWGGVRTWSSLVTVVLHGAACLCILTVGSLQWQCAHAADNMFVLL